jgi:flagellar biosynthesis protein FlhG
MFVTAPDAVSVMDAYALIKTLLTRHPLAQPLELVVNHLDDGPSAADVHRRIDQSCRRFLGHSVNYAGAVPHDLAAAHSSDVRLPPVLANPDGPLAIAVGMLVRHFVQLSPETAINRRAA